MYVVTFLLIQNQYKNLQKELVACGFSILFGLIKKNNSAQKQIHVYKTVTINPATVGCMRPIITLSLTCVKYLHTSEYIVQNIIIFVIKLN